MADVPAAGGFPGQARDLASVGGRASDLASDHADGLAIRAEQALLGAVMSDPGQAAALDLVQAGDMLRPYHGQVLAAVKRLRGRGVTPEPVAVRAELAADPDLPPSVSRDGLPLIDLLEAAPAPGHAAAYAAMVIERGIRQEVALAASRIVQAAETGELDDALRMVAEAGRVIRDSQARWEALPERIRRELPERAARRSVRAEEAARQLRAASNQISQARQDAESDAHADLAGRLAAIGRHVESAARASSAARRDTARVSAEPRPAGPEAEAAGSTFLRDLAAGPGQVVAVRAWLRPDHFARPAHGSLYALVRDMHAAGKPVDPVTIAWEAARRGIVAEAGELAGGNASFIVADAREVHRHGCLARIARAGHDVGSAAGDAHVQVARLLRDAGRRLHEVQSEPGPDTGPPTARRLPQRAALRAQGTMQPRAAPESRPRSDQRDMTARPA